MKSFNQPRRLLEFVRQHWFKAAFISLVLYLMLAKDLRFSIRLHSPAIQQQSTTQPQGVSFQKEKLTKTDNEPSGFLDKFEIPFIFSSPAKRVGALQDLKNVSEADRQAFMKRFARVVINERHKYGIPSSILLASGMLHSQAGQRDMAMIGNNFFALPCSVDWQGTSGRYDGNCYRHYKTAWDSFRDHSVYLTSSQFASLTTLSASDYRAWAQGLEQLGYGREGIAESLIAVIEKYGLDNLDHR